MNKWTVILVLGVMFFLIIIVLVGIQQGWFERGLPQLAQLEEVNGVEVDKRTGKPSAKYRNTAQSIYDQMNGTNWNIGNLFGDPAWENLARQLESFSYNELVLVANEYRQISGSSLRDLWAGEYTGCLSPGNHSYQQGEPCYNYYEVLTELNQIGA